MESEPRYRRVLLKLSGEALAGADGSGIDPDVLHKFAGEIAAVHHLGVQVGLVIGGGNYFRGAKGVGIERATGDYMGMLATVMNALAMGNALEQRGVRARVLSALPLGPVCESFDRRAALGYLDEGRVVLFAAGTGNPYFTTDTAATLRAIETGCDALFKGTQVDGVYSADPKKTKDAVRYDRVSYSEALAKDLKVMDATAIALARENAIPIVVFSIHNPGAFAEVVAGRGRFTVVGEGA
ncbi:MAG: UMP kinase [Magnetospirillum sp. WYHS-4]